MIPRLGVNIDHVATLRQARGENYPSVVNAATTCFNNGCDQLTIHLREDRRHIQDIDVSAIQLVTKKFGKPLNLEMGCAPEIIDIAIATQPDWICLVPENREEKTTEGGLNLLDSDICQKVANTCKKLKEKIPGIKISFFVESDLSVLHRVAELNGDAVEIHTGDYAMAFLNGNDVGNFLEKYNQAHKFIAQKNIGFHAGHGLTAESVTPLLEQGLFAEYNIGHWIICEALFDGLGPVVSSLKESFQKYQV
ncbi:MAG: pyridoxine 5'-phosphate synthase, partial [Halobacteriovoraceae bacterium]|nr:pyridoxine 5'-phosphate synthase [Halobacteriovoraceae bacterium]